MKVALVHDYLDQFGGQERVLLNLIEIFPEAPVYTLLYEPQSLGHLFGDKEIHTSFADKPFIRKRHRLFIPILGHAAQSLDLGDKYDLIISNTMGFVKNIRYKRGFHLSYIHSPLRYAWEPWTYLPDLFPRPLIWAGMPAIRYMRWQDKRSAQKPDYILANSHHIAGKIRDFYGREAAVLHPPVEDALFYRDPHIQKQNYYLIYGRIIHYKKFPMVIRAFKRLGLPLKVVGAGPEEHTVRELMNGTNGFQYLSFIKDENKLREIICGAKASIIPQIEDFGLVTAESIACGTPVIGYNRGGTVEVVQDGVNGILFDSQTEEGVMDAVRRFEKLNFDPKTVAKTAERFSKESFKKRFAEIVRTVVNV
ncbi:MAG: glycosyltransferase [Candidatus Colwellbacteria bacterium]|nr:glycosyltransferase [Candidatus Colwellbacteria bacterium]